MIKFYGSNTFINKVMNTLLGQSVIDVVQGRNVCSKCQRQTSPGEELDGEGDHLNCPTQDK